MVVARKDTRELLIDSLLELSQTLPLNKITVQAISDNCGVSTRTFYNHFADKFDLVAWTYAREVGEAFHEILETGGGYYAFQLSCIERMVAKGAYYANAIKNTHGFDSIRIVMRRYNLETLGPWLDSKVGSLGADERLRFSLDFYLQAAVDAMIRWYEEGMPVEPETLARWITDDMPVCLQPYLMGA